METTPSHGNTGMDTLQLVSLGVLSETINEVCLLK
jgi:hypothetical protein